MEAKHTAGPWHRNIKPVTKYPTVFAGRNTHIAKVVEQGIGLSEAEANCDLICAAPQLFEALRMLTAMARTTGGTPGPDVPLMAAILNAEEALAKASGSPA